MKSIFQVFSFDILSKALMGITGILLIRYMNQGEYARYILAFSLMMVATQAFTISFNRIYIVGHRRLKLGELSSPFLGFQLLGILILALLAYPFMGRSGSLYWFTVAATIATCFSEFTKTFFQEKMRFISFSAVEICRTLLIAAGTVAAIYLLGNKLSAWQVLLIQAAAMSLVFLVAFGKRLDIRGLLKIRRVLSLAGTIASGQYRYLFGYFILFSFFGQLDIFMLRGLSNDATVATYGSAFRYYTLIIMALSSAHAVLLPMTQKAQSMGELRVIFRKYAKLVLIFAPIVLLGAWASQWIIPMIDAGKYPQAVNVFRILSISAIFSFALSPHVNLVMRYERFRFLLITVVIAIFSSVGLNFLLVPYWGAVGTAVSTLISFAFVNGSTYIMAKRLLRSNTIPPGEPLVVDETEKLPANINQTNNGVQQKTGIGDPRIYVIKLRLKAREFARKFRRPVKVVELDKFFLKKWRGQPPDNNYFTSRSEPKFLFKPAYKRKITKALKRHFPQSCQDIIDRAELIREHKFDLLGSGLTPLGQKIDWHTDFKSGHSWPKEHFTKIQIINRGDNSDVKIPWELSRLQFLTDLGRAAWLTDDPTYKFEFKAIVSNWEAFNPVDIGVNWTCSMEVAIRAINIIWGIHYFRFDESECEFVRRTIKLLYYHGYHIEKNLETVSERANSNHLISDYLGLFYLGLLLPELKRAARWKKLGLAGLEKQIRSQVFPDGADYECSTSYHRLVLEIFLSAFLLGKKNNIKFTENYETRLGAMLDFSESVTAPSGLAPLVGDNDDGFIVKLSTDNPADHRQLVDIGRIALGKRSSIDIPSSEERLWYLGVENLSITNNEEAPGSHLFENGGHAIIRAKDFHLLFNAAGVPKNNFGGHKHNDLLSVTLELDGIPFLIDPGTFCYSADFDMRNFSRSVACHNTVVVDEEEQNRYLPNKLFFLMRDASPRINLYTKTEKSVIVSALHDGYRRLEGGIIHRRTLTAWPASKQIHLRDDFTGQKGKRHSFSMRFVTPILNIRRIDRSSLELCAGNRQGLYMRASEEGLEDLIIFPIDYFPRFGVKAPAMLITFNYRCSLPFGFSTSIGLMKHEPIITGKPRLVEVAV